MNKRLRVFCFFPIFMGFVLLLLIITTESNVLAADVVVVANRSVAENALSSEKVKAIFLGQTTKWQSGSPVEFVTLKDDIAAHDGFLKNFIGKSPTQFKNFWKQQVFTGKGRLPKQFDSESKLIEYVSTKDGAVGYVSSKTATGSAKVISINQ